MKLTAEQFAELASTFDAQQGRTKHERRRASRMDLQARIKITPVIDGDSHSTINVTICDFSARGISFIHEQAMDIGQQFVLELPRREGGPVSLLCTVMHVKAAGHNLHRMGAEFTCGVQTASRDERNSSSQAAEAERIRASMLG